MRRLLTEEAGGWREGLKKLREKVKEEIKTRRRLLRKRASGNERNEGTREEMEKREERIIEKNRGARKEDCGDRRRMRGKD